MTTSTITPLPPNHHADHEGFAGIRGALWGVLFTVGSERSGGLAARLAELAPTDHVVDIGCGPGTALRTAARRGARATGVDPAPAMLRVARWFTRPGSAIDYRLGTAEALPLPAGDATVAWSIRCVHHWRDLEAGLAEVTRVLAPGGRFVALERLTDEGADGLASHGWTQAQAEAFADACRAAGFVDVRVELPQDSARRRGRSQRGGLIGVRATTPS